MNVMDVSEVAGDRLGSEGVEQLVERAEVVCAWQKAKIELTRQPALFAKRAEYAVLLEEQRQLKARLYLTPQPQRASVRIRKIVISWIVASVLIVGGFVLSLLTLGPYRMGLKGVFYCVGIALVAPFLIERVLELFASETLRRVLAVLACLGAIASLMLLADIRGNLLVQQTGESSPSVVIDEEELRQDQSKRTFYQDTVPLLQLVMVLLALSMEIGAGLAVHEAERLSASAEGDHRYLLAELRNSQAQLSTLVQEIVGLENAAAVFVATFWRDFYWSLLKKFLRTAASRFVLPIALLLVVLPSAVWGQEATNLVVALDLTKSVDKNGPDGKTDFAKNIACVEQLVLQVTPGAHITVLGITDNSFGQPYILLSAKVDSDSGYFGERIATSRRQLVHAWRRKTQDLRPRYLQTDILGALLVAGQLFRDEAPNHRRILVILSDMRQDTRELAIGQRAMLADKELDLLKKEQLIADLSGIDVYVLGVDESTARTEQWMILKGFWLKYFAVAGGRLRQYSALHTAAGDSIFLRSKSSPM